jgi:hypothetical protein
MRLAGHAVCMGANRNAYRISVGKTEGKRLLGMPKLGWEDNKMNLTKI